MGNSPCGHSSYKRFENPNEYENRGFTGWRDEQSRSNQQARTTNSTHESPKKSSTKKKKDDKVNLIQL